MPSIASEETLCWSGSTLHQSRTCKLGPRHVLEEHKLGLGPGTMMNTGPPFKVRDVILCNIPGHLWGMDPLVNWLQQGFIMEADHPCYKIRMEKGATVWTTTGESWLRPRPASGQFAKDQDDPFKELRSDPALRIGSYGLHVDSHHHSL